MTVKLTRADRQQIVEQYLAGERIVTIAARWAIHERTVHRLATAAGLTHDDRRLAALEAELAYDGGWVRDGMILRPTLGRAMGGAA